MEDQDAFSCFDVGRRRVRPGARCGNRRSRRAEPQPAVIIEYCPGVGRLRPGLSPRAGPLEPVARRMDPAALRPELAQSRWRLARILRRRLSLLAPLRLPIRLLVARLQTARSPGRRAGALPSARSG